MHSTTKILNFKNQIGFLFVCLILFSSCKKELQQTIENPKFVRTWYDTVQGMPFRAKLSIKENNTFEYASRAGEVASVTELAADGHIVTGKQIGRAHV